MVNATDAVGSADRTAECRAERDQLRMLVQELQAEVRKLQSENQRQQGEIDRLERYKRENPARQEILAEPIIDDPKETPDRIDPKTMDRLIAILPGIFHQSSSVGDVVSRLRGYHRIAPGVDPGEIINELIDRVALLERKNQKLRARNPSRSGVNA